MSLTIREEIKKHLQSERYFENRYRLSGFGTFKVKERKARTGRNPQTGAKIKIGKRKTPRFSPAKALKDAII